MLTWPCILGTASAGLQSISVPQLLIGDFSQLSIGTSFRSKEFPASAIFEAKLSVGALQTFKMSF
jgi:hypothetical protein